MNAAKIAAALNTISVAFGELAEALNEQPGPPRPVESVAARVPSAPADLPPIDDFDEALREAVPEGHEAICPAHQKPFIEGTYGAYCPGKGIDPAWTNKRGYCTVTPKNVAAYLRVHAA